MRCYSSVSLLIAAFAVSGCLSDVQMPEGLPFLKKPDGAAVSAEVDETTEGDQGEAKQGFFKRNFKENPFASSPFAKKSDTDDVQQGDTHSEIIAGLQARRSIVPSGSYLHVADAALASGASKAEAELRSAKLRAEAEDKNWLPTIGPSISLTSLGDAIASLLVEQVVFDNGRRKADRAYAAADVEVAAVTVSEDMNERVFTALSLYVTGVRGDETAQKTRTALAQMKSLEEVVIGRVQGGVSDRGDQLTVESKIQDLESTLKNAGESAVLARSELSAMTKQSFVGVYEGPLDVSGLSGSQNLAVLRAKAEAKRTIAQADSARAASLPGLTAGASVGTGGTNASLNGGGADFGFGTGARLKAIESTKETAERSIVEAEQDAERALRRGQHQISSLERKQKDATRLSEESYETFELFQAQFKAGQRSILEVINIYEKAVERDLAALDAKYDVLIAQLEMARDLGLLADGDEI